MNILVLCTYPISSPRHGGQIRVRNIVDCYRAAGYHVEVAGVLGGASYASEAGFAPFPGVGNLSHVIANPFLMEDYAIGRLFSEEHKAYNTLAASIRCKPDWVHVEQPWLFAFARAYVREHAPGARILYGSQNVEWRLKQEICSSYFDSDVACRNADLVKHVEIAAIHEADAVACVSEGDAEWVKSQVNKPVLVVPNGVRAWQSTDDGRAEATAITLGCRYALYCASAHPPNMQGFFSLFQGGFGSLKPDEKIVVAGSAGYAIAGDVRLNQSAKLSEKLVVAGSVSQSCLDGLLDGASCIVLPLTQGGGTNLKTAEALWTGKHMVATNVAMRGFEHFIGATGVHVADDAASFKRALRAAMEAKPLVLTAQETEARRSVLWENCLKPLVSFIENLPQKNLV